MKQRLKGHPARVAWLIVAGLIVAMIGIGCGGDDDGGGGGGDAISEIGEPEGELNLLCWPSYCEDGSNDPKVDWISDFEKDSGCQVNVKVFGTSDEAVELMRTGQYDGVSASGNASVRLYEGGDVDPVNLDLVPNYETVFEDLKDTDYNTFDGVNYGTPHGRGANLLIWNTEQASDVDGSTWAPLLDPEESSQYKGQLSVYDDPIYIADAALYLKTHQPDLGIEDPYELDEEQFNAAVDLLKEQQKNVGEYWHDFAKQISSFANADSTVGTTWQYQYLTLSAEGDPVASTPASQGFLPEEDATGWSDTWMLSSEAANPNCMYLWMDHIISPETNAKVAAYFGEAPGQSKSCDLIGDLPPQYFGTASHCKDYNAENTEFWSRVHYWKTPLADCGDDRGEVCKDYNAWVQAWTEIKG